MLFYRIGRTMKFYLTHLSCRHDKRIRKQKLTLQLTIRDKYRTENDAIRSADTNKNNL